MKLKFNLVYKGKFLVINSVEREAVLSKYLGRKGLIESFTHPKTHLQIILLLQYFSYYCYFSKSLLMDAL